MNVNLGLLAMYYFHFTITDISDLQSEGENTLIDTLQQGLTLVGFACSTLPPGTSGTQLSATKNGTTYHIQCRHEAETLPHKVLIAVGHSRGAIDKLLGRNKLAPQNYIEKTLREIIKALPEVSGLQESLSFGEIEVDNGTFTEIRR